MREIPHIAFGSVNIAGIAIAGGMVLESVFFVPSPSKRKRVFEEVYKIWDRNRD
jgi:hypothetical protein